MEKSFLEPTISERCTLRQACEWIAFGWEPMAQPDENALSEKRIRETKEYTEKLTDAAAKLKIALAKDVLPSTEGSPIFFNHNVSTFGAETKEIVEVSYEGELWTPMKLSNFNFELMLVENMIKVPFKREQEKGYADVLIVFGELKDVFSKVLGRRDLKPTYLSPYMEIMIEVANELKITENNQPQKKALVDVFKKQMKKYGLKESGNFADYMASLVRLPASQKGGRKKK